MFNLLISQRVNIDVHGETIDALERANTDYFNSLGISIYPISSFVQDLDVYLDGIQYNGLILSGGGDVNPGFSNEKDVHAFDYSPERDKVESHLIDKFVSLKLPILGICHGMQQLNCFFGGKITANIHQNEINFRKPPLNHSIRIRKCIFGLNGEYSVNHYHHHGIKKTQVAQCFDVFAIDDYHDDVAEGIIHKNLPIIGIQWHPERDSPDDDVNRRIIKGLFKI